MRGRWRLAACVVVVLLTHAGLMAALSHAPTSGVWHPAPHQTAPIRIVVLGPIAEPAEPPPPHLRPAADGARPMVSAPAPAETASTPAAMPETRAVAARSALAPERVASAPPSPEMRTIAPTREFLSPAEVDRIAIAFPSPDISSLSGLSWSGVPIRLRLFITASGQCVDVKMLRASEDAETLERVRQMFLATHFLPAQHARADVDSYRDIELDVTDVK